jgi:putative ABC transport system ATP-binding protein
MASDLNHPLEAVGLNRTYGGGAQGLAVLKNVSLSVSRGEVVAIMGPSGSGKSTLLFILAGLDEPDAGSVKLATTDWATLSGTARAQFRRRNCGFIAQGMSLLPQATAAENVEVPLLLDGMGAAQRSRKVAESLERVGLTNLASSLTDELSGGEQQRVAIARAMVLRPAVVLADEPTGSLDSVTAQSVIRFLVDEAREHDTALVLVTHDPAIARHAHRIVTMHSGELT